MNNVNLLSADTEFGQKILARFGQTIGHSIINFFRTEGLPIELPTKFADGITLSESPKLRLELSDSDGLPLKGSDIARCNRWILFIDDKPANTLKSLEIPKLDYSDPSPLTVKLEFYAVGGDLACCQ